MFGIGMKVVGVGVIGWVLGILIFLVDVFLLGCIRLLSRFIRVLRYVRVVFSSLGNLLDLRCLGSRFRFMCKWWLWFMFDMYCWSCCVVLVFCLGFSGNKNRVLKFVFRVRVVFRLVGKGVLSVVSRVCWWVGFCSVCWGLFFWLLGSLVFRVSFVEKGMYLNLLLLVNSSVCVKVLLLVLMLLFSVILMVSCFWLL